MPSYRISRLQEDFKREISLIIPKLKDPRVKSDMISVLRVEITNDLSHAKIYISAVKGMWSAQRAAEGMKNAEGFIKHALCETLRMRKCPMLHFIPDDSIAFGAHLNELFKEMHQEDHSQE